MSIEPLGSAEVAFPESIRADAAAAESSQLRRSLALGELLRGRADLATAGALAGMPPSEMEALADAVRQGTGGSTERTDDETAPRLSVVVPVWNEEENLPALYERLAPVLADLGSYEIIIVDDGSHDRSAEIALDLGQRDPGVKVLELSRNFGHQAALSAGLAHARGEAVVFMDADLQDPPELLPEFVRQWEGGNDVVYAVRQKRKEGWAKRFSYFVFYRLLHGMAEVTIPLDSGDFCLMDRRAVDALNALPEKIRFLRGLRSWVGFKQVGVAYDRPARNAGEVKYTRPKLVKLALDGLVSFTSFPLRLASYLGFFTAMAGLLYLAVAVLWRLTVGHVPAGWTSLIAIILVIGGAQLCVSGIIGEYLARVYDETKQRPHYVIKATHGWKR